MASIFSWCRRLLKDAQNVLKWKNFQQNKIHLWPKEKEPWAQVHMDHAHLKGMGLFLIFVDSYSGWLKIIKVADRKATTIKQILRTIFSSNEVPKTLVSDDMPECCNKNLCSWLKHIGCIPYKMMPYYLQSNRIIERMVQTIANETKSIFPIKWWYRDLPRSLLSYRTFLHATKVTPY